MSGKTLDDWTSLPDSQSNHRLVSILSQLDASPVECDGFARLATTLLHHEGIPHWVMHGSLTGPAGDISVHFWIEVNGLVCDFRARMWLGPEAPHGLFEPSPEWRYRGGRVDMDPLPDQLFHVLCGRPIADFLPQSE